MAARKKPAAGNQNYGVDYASFAESMMDTSLYGVGAYFCDQHPDLVDDVINESDAIETRRTAGLRRGQQPRASMSAFRLCSQDWQSVTTRRSLADARSYFTRP